MVSLAEAACAVLMSWNAMAGHDVLQSEQSETPVALAVDTIADARPALALAPLALSQPAGLTLARRSPQVMTGLGILDASPQDTVRKPRAKAYTYSDNYYWRLKWHKRLSWAMLPLFAASYFSGNEILQASEESREAASWATNIHGPAATGSAILFSANTITGGMNLWEGRKDPNGRTRRIVHSVLFITASAGFVYAGTALANDAEQSNDKRLQHRNVAIASMSVATLSWLVMLIGN